MKGGQNVSVIIIEVSHVDGIYGVKSFMGLR